MCRYNMFVEHERRNAVIVFRWFINSFVLAILAFTTLSRGKESVNSKMKFRLSM